MQVRFWGTRGSIATPGPETLRYGGNTSCVEVRTESGALLILDCGTGARKLGLELARSGPVKAHLLLGHTHADHIQGLPFFVPAFVPGSELTVYGPAGIDRDLPSAIGGQMEYAYFPVPLQSLPATFRFVELGEGEQHIEGVRVRAQFLNHTSPCLGYRIEVGGVTLVYVADHEPYAGLLWKPDRAPDAYETAALLHPGDRRHVDFLRGADLVIHDAQYTDAEYPGRLGWGHSTVEQVVAMALAAGVKRAALFHHDPLRDDASLDALVAEARALVDGAGAALHVSAAAEGTTVELAEDSTWEDAPQPETERHETLGGRVLIADDDPAVRRVLEMVLRQDGCQVTAVDNGEAAVREAASRDFDLILLDVQMPELDGYGACRALRADPRHADVPIVFLTARGDREDMLEGFAAQATDYMVKPLAVAQVRARVRAWLSRTPQRV